MKNTITFTAGAPSRIEKQAAQVAELAKKNAENTAKMQKAAGKN